VSLRPQRCGAGRAAMLALMLCLGTIALAPPVHAASGILTCSGTETLSFDPAVTNTPKSIEIAVSDLFGPCPITPDPQLTGGSVQQQFTATASCTTIVLSPPHSETYPWNDGKQSVVAFTTTLVTQLANGSLVVVQEGTVTSGLDKGFIATKTTTDPAFSTVCDSPQGMKTLSGLVTVEFVGL
jgi:hypothetical protein